MIGQRNICVIRILPSINRTKFVQWNSSLFLISYTLLWLLIVFLVRFSPRHSFQTDGLAHRHRDTIVSFLFYSVWFVTLPLLLGIALPNIIYQNSWHYYSNQTLSTEIILRCTQIICSICVAYALVRGILIWLFLVAAAAVMACAYFGFEWLLHGNSFFHHFL